VATKKAPYNIKIHSEEHHAPDLPDFNHPGFNIRNSDVFRDVCPAGSVISR